MKKTISLFAFGISMLTLCTQAASEDSISENFYELHPPAYYNGSKAPIRLNGYYVKISVKDLITDVGTMKYWPEIKISDYSICDGYSPSFPNVGYLPSREKIDLEITAINSDGESIQFIKTIEPLPVIHASVPFNIQVDGVRSKFNIEGEIKCVELQEFKGFFEEAPLVAGYEISIKNIEKLSSIEIASNQSVPKMEVIPPNLLQQEAVRDVIADDIKHGGYVFVNPGHAYSDFVRKPTSGVIHTASVYDRSVVNKRLKTIRQDPKNAADISSRVAGQFAGYRFLGVARYLDDAAFNGQMLGIEFNGEMKGVLMGFPFKGPVSTVPFGELKTCIRHEQIDFNMTPSAANPVYEKVPVFIVTVEC